MAIVWGDFEDMTLYYMKCLGGEKDEGVVLFQRIETGNYGVCTSVEYGGLVDRNDAGTFWVVMAMTAEEFIGLMLIRVSDIVEVATSADVTESVQAGDKPGDLVAGVDAGADREREGEDAGGGSDAEEVHKAVSESGETVD